MARATKAATSNAIKADKMSPVAAQVSKRDSTPKVGKRPLVVARGAKTTGTERVSERTDTTIVIRTTTAVAKTDTAVQGPGAVKNDTDLKNTMTKGTSIDLNII